MDNLLSHDPRIEEGTALRDLEKKLHWVITMLGYQGSVVDYGGSSLTFPDDLNVPDVYYDWADVQANMVDTQKQTSGGNGKGLG